MQPGMFGLQISGILQNFIFYFATESLVGPESSLVNILTRLKINPNRKGNRKWLSESSMGRPRYLWLKQSRASTPPPLALSFKKGFCTTINFMNNFVFKDLTPVETFHCVAQGQTTLPGYQFFKPGRTHNPGYLPPFHSYVPIIRCSLTTLSFACFMCVSCSHSFVSITTTTPEPWKTRWINIHVGHDEDWNLTA